MNVLALVLLIFGVSHARAESLASLHEVSGVGVARGSEAECNAKLKKFQEKLEVAGLKLSAPIECEAVEGEPSTFAPTFKTRSEKKLVAETAAAIPVAAVERCEEALSTLSKVVAESGESILDQGCARV